MPQTIKKKRKKKPNFFIQGWIAWLEGIQNVPTSGPFQMDDCSLIWRYVNISIPTISLPLRCANLETGVKPVLLSLPLPVI